MRRALRPLARLARAAAEIERTGDSRRRLPEPQRDDEVGRLATTLNAMLASLERSREAERRFLADASHELRTPLTALRGNVELPRRHGATPELVADSQADAERLARLADDLLALSREEAAAPPDDACGSTSSRAAPRRPTSTSTREPVSVAATAPRSSARSRTSSRTRGATGRPAGAITVARRPARRRARCSRSRTRAPG